MRTPWRRRSAATTTEARLFSALSSVASRLQLSRQGELQTKQVAPPPKFQDLDGDDIRVRTVFISDVHLGERQTESLCSTTTS